MKDAHGHGSDGKGGSGGKSGMVRVSVARPIGSRIADIGPGGKEYNVKTDAAWDAAHQTGVAAAGAVPSEALAPGGRHGYNPTAVANAIASSNRAGRRIGSGEARMIHALLKGRG